MRKIYLITAINAVLAIRNLIVLRKRISAKRKETECRNRHSRIQDNGPVYLTKSEAMDIEKFNKVNAALERLLDSSRHITVKALCEETGISQRRLYDLILRKTGLRPNEYIKYMSKRHSGHCQS